MIEATAGRAFDFKFADGGVTVAPVVSGMMFRRAPEPAKAVLA